MILEPAVFSENRMYRYALRRQVSPWTRGSKGHVPGHDTVLFVMLNPSTADEIQDDPTIRRCFGFAHRWGYKRLLIGNIFAYRATDPRELKIAHDPIGPLNNRWLAKLARDADLVIAAWGTHGNLDRRHEEVLAMFGRMAVPLHALNVTKDGFPGHPLYRPLDAVPRRYPRRGSR